MSLVLTLALLPALWSPDVHPPPSLSTSFLAAALHDGRVPATTAHPLLDDELVVYLGPHGVDGLPLVIRAHGGPPVRLLGGPRTLDELDDVDLVPTATIDAADLDPAPTTISSSVSCPFHATLRSLGRWLVVLVSLVFVVALLGSVGAARRPLPLAALAVRQPLRPVPLVERLLVLACLWSPMLMLLSLLQAEREMLSSVLLCMSVAGAVAAAAMLGARRRLLRRLRWAYEGRLRASGSGQVVRAEVDPKRLVSPPGATGPVPWFAADLVCAVSGGGEHPVSAESARVALDGAVVDEGAARALVRMAMGLPARTKLTVVGLADLAPADASAVTPFDREAPMQARIGSRALVIAGSPAAFAARLRAECVLLGCAVVTSVSAAALVLL
jgi:hypothetical protein